MNTLHFILGGGMTPDQWASLAQQVTAYYKAHIPGLTEVVCYHYDDDVHAQIAAKYTTGPLVICGHSFGGCKAVRVAAQFAADNRAVDHLFLFDPVMIESYNVPNPTFQLSANVGEAVCFYRGATEAPYSGMITAGPSFKNVLFPATGGGPASHHGDAVWDGSCMAYVATALAGNWSLPHTTPAPAPTPTPTPAPAPALVKTIDTITITYSDGSTDVFKRAS